VLRVLLEHARTCPEWHRMDSNFGPIMIAEPYRIPRIILAIMLMQRVYVLTCPNCREPISLPRQSLLGTFSYPQCQPTGIWPITYQCFECGHQSVHLHAKIYPLGIEVQVQNLSVYKFAYCEFEQENDGRKTRIFSRIDSSSSPEEFFGKLIKSSGVTPRGLVRHSVIEYLD